MTCLTKAEYYFPVVDFVSRDGRRHSVQLTEGSSSPSHEVGDEVTVLYDPDHLLDARIKSSGSSALIWILPGITGALGFAFLAPSLQSRSSCNQQNKPDCRGRNAPSS
jgi:Protein of unknown function (DUF3592)